MTFSFYLLHTPILIAVHANFSEAPYGSQIAIAFFATFGGSYMIYAKVEPLLAKNFNAKLIEDLIIKIKHRMPKSRTST